MKYTSYATFVVIALTVLLCSLTPAREIAECGRLEGAGSWTTIFHGASGDYGTLSLYPFGDGDSVWVQGDVFPCPVSFPSGPDSCLSCYWGPCEVTDYGCGVLSRACEEDPGSCICFWSDAWPGLALTDYGGFALGDTVHVRGAWLEPLASYCTFTGYIRVTSITRCDTLNAVRAVSLGRLKTLYR